MIFPPARPAAARDKGARPRLVWIITPVALMTGLKDGELIHWSHMLAARVASRDRGLGQRLKLYQRMAGLNAYHEIALALEAVEKGFDEVQFDYVRFPSDGYVNRAVFGVENTLSNRVDAIDAFTFPSADTPNRLRIQRPL